MLINPDYFSNASKDLSRANLNAAEKFLQHGVDSIGELMSLNIEFTTAASRYYFDSFDKSLEVKNPNELRDVIESNVKPITQKAKSYTLQMSDLGNRTAMDLQEVIKGRVDDSLENFIELIGTIEGSVPSAAGPIAAALKTNLAVWQSAYSKITAANVALNENFRDQIESFVIVADSEIHAKKSAVEISGQDEEVHNFAADTEGGGME